MKNIDNKLIEKLISIWNSENKNVINNSELFDILNEICLTNDLHKILEKEIIEDVVKEFSKIEQVESIYYHYCEDIYRKYSFLIDVSENYEYESELNFKLFKMYMDFPSHNLEKYLYYDINIRFRWKNENKNEWGGYYKLVFKRDGEIFNNGFPIFWCW